MCIPFNDRFIRLKYLGNFIKKIHLLEMKWSNHVLLIIVCCTDGTRRTVNCICRLYRLV